MAVKFTNNAVGQLASAVAADALTFALSSGQGAAFPALTGDGSDWCYVTFINAAGTKEIVKCTARSGDVFTIPAGGRAQDGTGALAMAGGETVSLRVTRIMLQELAMASGTKAFFQQTAAPLGWTKDTSHNDKAIRLVSGAAGTGGSTAFSTVFGRTATDGHALTSGENGPHGHSTTLALTVTGGATTAPVTGSSAGVTGNGLTAPAIYENTGPDVSKTSTSGGASVPAHNHTVGGTVTADSSGSGTAHTHPIDTRVHYVDTILCSKDSH